MRNRFVFALLLLLSASGISLYAQSPTVGVIDAQADMSEGYILFAHIGFNEVYLIDNCGRLINKWSNSAYTPGATVTLLPDGSLLKTGKIPNSEFVMGGVGGRLERWSWDDSLMWSYNYSTTEYTQHHDIEVLPNGNIVLLAAEAERGLEPIQQGRNPALIFANTVWSEYLVELKPLGQDSAEVVWEWHVWDHLIQSYNAQALNYGVVADHPELIDLNFVPGVPSRDWLHANSVTYNAELDQLMLSIAHFDEVWVIDHGTTTAQAAGHTGGARGKGGDLLYRWGNPLAYQRGDSSHKKLFFQHDAHWLPAGSPDSGKVIIFNNGVGRAYSSVEIITLPESAPGEYLLNPGAAYGPATADLTWTANPPGGFFSKIMSSATQLPSGNLLISHGADGYALEINPQGQQVWRYQSPVAGTNLTPQGSVPAPGSSSVFRWDRYAPDFPGFAGKDMSPGDPIEPGFDIADCLTVLTDRMDVREAVRVSVFPNPVMDKLYLEAGPGGGLPFALHDLLGRQVYAGILNGRTVVDVAGWPAGIYVLSGEGLAGRRIVKINP